MEDFVKDVSATPVIIAYSGFVDNDARKKGKDAGFAFVIESPLTQEKLKDFVLPILERRKNNLRKLTESSHRKSSGVSSGRKRLDLMPSP